MPPDFCKEFAWHFFQIFVNVHDARAMKNLVQVFILETFASSI